MMPAYHCPACKQLIELNDDVYVCAACASSWQVRNNVPVFTKDEYYYGEVPRPDMQRILDDAEHLSWNELQQHIFADRPWFNRYVFDESRADWRFLLPITTNSRILDLGCGWGTIAIPLSRMSKEVHAIDPVYERARFVDIRRRAIGCNNVYPICSSFDSLPFPDGYFDIVIMNGVLEWTPTSILTRSPANIQMAYLQMVCKLLRRDGHLYLGIENRFGFHYLLGWKDDHSHLRFTTLMPRPIASLYSCLRKGHPYRTYTYGKRGYESMLAAAGFKSLQFHFPVPFYHTPRYILPMNDVTPSKGPMRFFLGSLFNPSSLKRRLLRSALRYLPNPAYLRTLYPSFIIDASKTMRHPSVVESLLREAIPEIHAPPTVIGIRGRAGQNSSVGFMVFLNCEKTPSYFLKLARSPEYNASITNEWHNITHLLCEAHPIVRASLPEVVASDLVANHAYLITRFVYGHGMAGMMKQLRGRRLRTYVSEAFTSCCQWLIRLQLTSGLARSDTRMTPNALATRQRRRVVLLQEGFPSLRSVSRVANDAYRYLGTTEVPLVLRHGDFMPNNVITGHDGIAVLDWELAESARFPFYDLAYFILWTSALINRDEPLRDLEGSFRFAFLDSTWLSHLVAAVVGRYFAATPISLSLVKPLLQSFIADKALLDLAYFQDTLSSHRFLHLLAILDAPSSADSPVLRLSS